MKNDPIELLREYAGCEPESQVRLTAAGSNRVYYRYILPGGGSVVGVEGTNKDENAAFLSIGRHLRSAGLPVPEILAVSESGMCYLLEDLGDDSLFGLMESARESGVYAPGQKALLEKVMTLLPDLQFKGGKGLDYSVCFPCESFDSRSIMWDLNYFKYSFLKPSGLEFHEARLEDDFERLVKVLLKDAPYDGFGLGTGEKTHSPGAIEAVHLQGLHRAYLTFLDPRADLAVTQPPLCLAQRRNLDTADAEIPHSPALIS